MSDERLAELKQRLNAYCASKAVVTRLLSNREFKVEEIYINLLLIKEIQAKEKEGKLKQAEQAGDAAVRHLCYEQIRGEKESIDIERIFDSTEGGTEPNRRVVIFGCAGSGKTTLCKYIVKRWMGQKEQGSRLAPLWADKFEWVFWIPLRNVVAGSYADLLDTIYYVCFGGEASGFSKKDIQRLWNQMDKSKVLLLLDGFDEVAGYYYPNKENSPLTQLLSDAFAGSIILTSRPYAVESNLPSFKHHLEVTGFTIENVSHYVENFFPGNSVLAKDLIAFLDSNPTLRNLAQIPINLELLCDIWESTPPSKDVQVQLAQFTVTEIYEKIVEYLMRRYLEKFSSEYKDRKADTKNLDLNDLEVLLKLEIKFTESLAFKMEIQGKLILQGKEISEDKILRATREGRRLFPMLSDLGFLKGAELGERTDGSDIAKEYYFLHLTLQEFFTARFITRWIKYSCKKEDAVQATKVPIPFVLINGRNYSVQEFIAEYKYNPRYEIVWGFVAGLLRKDCRELNFFFACLLGEPRDLVGLYSSLLHIRCLEECLPQQPPSKFSTCIIKQLENLLLHWCDEVISKKHQHFLYLDHFDLVLEQLQLSPKVIMQLREVIWKKITEFISLLKGQNKFVRSSAASALIKLTGVVSQEAGEIIEELLLSPTGLNESSFLNPVLLRLGRIVPEERAREVILKLLNFLRSDQGGHTKPLLGEFFDELGEVVPEEQAGEVVLELLFFLLSGKDENRMVLVEKVLLKLGKRVLQEQAGLVIEKVLAIPSLSSVHLPEPACDSAISQTFFANLLVADTSGGFSAGITDKILLLLSVQHHEVRNLVLDVLCYICKKVSEEEAREIIDKILSLLEGAGQDGEVRSFMIDVLGYLGEVVHREEVGGIIKKLLLLFKRQNLVIRFSESNVIYNFCKVLPQNQAGKIFGEILSLFEGIQDEEVRLFMIDVLGYLGEVVPREKVKGIIEKLLSLLKDKNLAIRSSAVEVIGKFCKVLPKDQTGKIFGEISSLFEGIQDEGVRSLMICVIWYLRDAVPAVPREEVKGIIEKLLPLLKDKRLVTKSPVVEVIGKFCKVLLQDQAGKIFGEILSLFEGIQDEEVRSSMIDVLGYLGEVVPQEEVGGIIEKLLPLLKDKRLAIRSPVVNVLCKFCKVLPQDQAGKIFGEILSLFEGIQDEGVRSLRIRVLGYLGEVVPRKEVGGIIKKLLPLLKDKNLAIRFSVVELIGKLCKVVPQEQAGGIIEKILLLPLEDVGQDKDVRSSMVTALGYLGKIVTQEKVVGIIEGILLLLKGQNLVIRFSEAKVIDELCKVVPQEQAGGIIEKILLLPLEDVGQDAGVGYPMVFTLESLGKRVLSEQVESVIESILPLLTDQNKDSRGGRCLSCVFYELVSRLSQDQREKIVNSLLSLLTDSGTSDCVLKVICMLIELISKGCLGEIIKKLLLLLPRSSSIRNYVVRVLEKLIKLLLVKDEFTIVISQKQAGEIIDALLPLLKDHDKRVSSLTVGVLMDLARKLPQEVERIIIELLPFLLKAEYNEAAISPDFPCMSVDIREFGEVTQEQAVTISEKLLSLLPINYVSGSIVMFLYDLGRKVPQEQVQKIIDKLLLLLTAEDQEQKENVRYRVIYEVLRDLLKQQSLDAKGILRIGVGRWGIAMTCLLWLENRALFFASDPQCSGGVMVCWIDSSNEIRKVAVPKEEVQNLRLGIETAMRDMLGIEPQELVTPRSTIIPSFFPAPTVAALPPSPSASILSPQRDGDQESPESREAQEASSTSRCCIQ